MIAAVHAIGIIFVFSTVDLRAEGGVRGFSADDASITPGASVTLRWEVEPGQSSLRIDQGVGDVSGLTIGEVGSVVISPGPAINTSYTLSTDGLAGADSASLTVAVGEAPTINDFSAAVDPDYPESRRRLSWDVLGASDLQISPGIGRVPVSGSGYFQIVAAGSVWSYLDDGSDQGTAWAAPEFDDRIWAAGPGELGYGERDEATVVAYGSSTSAKAITTYFRHAFFRTAVDTIGELRLGIRYDDGAVVYLNGIEVGRYNMPDGTIAHSTPALGDVSGDANEYQFYDIPAEILCEGSNVFAVEIHQSRSTSSDMSFDMMCEGIMDGALPVVPVSNMTYTLAASNQFGTSLAELEVVISARPLAAYGFDSADPHDSVGRTAAGLDGAGAPSFVGGAGMQGAGAFAFGGDGAVRISGGGLLSELGGREMDAPLSIGFWIRAESTLAPGTMVMDAGIEFSKADAADLTGLNVELPGGAEFVIGEIFDNAWHHVAISLVTGTVGSPGRLGLYRDGELVAESLYSGGALNLPDEWIIGAASDGSGGLVGMIDDLAVFDRAISVGDVEQLTRDGAGSFLLPRILMFEADDQTVAPGAEIGLSWVVVDATSVEIDPGPGIVGAIGEACLVLPETTSIVLTASNADGATRREVTVTTGPVPEIRKFSFSPDVVPASGGGSILSWDVSGSIGVSIDHGIGAVGETGIRKLAVTSLSTFRMRAENKFGISSAVATAKVVDAPGGGAWTMVIIPDTQYYTESATDAPIFTEITQWIVDHRETHDIRFVLHEGDIVDNNLPIEWDRARASLSVLDGRVPFALTSGNHDLGPGGNAATRDGEFNLPTRFGAGSPYAAQPTLGGYFPGSGDPSYRESSYHTFHANGHDYLVLALEWSPRDEVLAWADQVVGAHPSHRAILVTHSYLTDSSRHWSGTVGAGENNGVEIWEGLVRPHENFIMTANGHMLSLGYLASTGEHGNTVHQMLFNAQDEPNGGDGWIRLLEFHPDGQRIDVRTFSPHREALGLSAWRTDAANQFTLQLGASPSTDSDGDFIPDAWESAYGLDPSDAGDAQLDPNGNGLSNFMEYATAGGPFASASSTSQAALSIDLAETGRKRIRFRRRIPGATNLTYAVERSRDLDRWAADPGDGSIFAELSVVNNGDSTQTVTIEDISPQLPDELPVFYRLRILSRQE